MLLEEGVGLGLAVALEVPEGLAVAVLGVRLQPQRELAAQVGPLSYFYGYDWLGSGVVAEGRPCRLDARRELRSVERLLRGWSVLLGDYVVDRLFHFLLSFIYKPTIPDVTFLGLTAHLLQPNWERKARTCRRVGKGCGRGGEVKGLIGCMNEMGKRNNNQL